MAQRYSAQKNFCGNASVVAFRFHKQTKNNYLSYVTHIKYIVLILV